MQSASRQAVKSCSEAVGLRVVQARSGGRTCRGNIGCRVSRVDFAHGWAKSFTRVATLRFKPFEIAPFPTGKVLPCAFVQIYPIVDGFSNTTPPVECRHQPIKIL